MKIGVDAIVTILEIHRGRLLSIIRWQVAQEAPCLLDHLFVGLPQEVRHAGTDRMSASAAEFFDRDIFEGHGLDDLGTGQKHVARAVDHPYEVGQGRGVDGAAGTRARDEADLRDDATGCDVAPENLAVSTESVHTLLDAGSARVIDCDKGRARLQRHVLKPADLVRMGLTEASAEHGFILCECVDRSTVDHAAGRDDAVARYLLFLEAKIVASVQNLGTDLLEGALVKKEFEASSRHSDLPRLLFDLDASL